MSTYAIRAAYGVESSLFDSIYSHQLGNNLCWAACIEMNLRYKGFEFPQLELASHTCGTDAWGNPYDCPATHEQLTRHLNIQWQEDGFCYYITAPLRMGSPNLSMLLEQLQSGNPVIVAYQTPNMPIGHAVNITAVDGYWLNGRYYIQNVIIRDPDSNRQNVAAHGYQVKDARTFLSTITAYWIIDIQVTIAEGIYELAYY